MKNKNREPSEFVCFTCLHVVYFFLIYLALANLKKITHDVNRNLFCSGKSFGVVKYVVHHWSTIYYSFGFISLTFSLINCSWWYYNSLNFKYCGIIRSNLIHQLPLSIHPWIILFEIKRAFVWWSLKPLLVHWSTN